MKVQITQDIEFCVQCPFHVIEPDPDPYDWYCDDDEALCCSHPDYPKEAQPMFFQEHKRYQYPVISGANRPYETPKIKVPEHCPLAKQIVQTVS